MAPPARLRPALHAEQALVRGILHGAYPPGSTLPAERDLAVRLGVTRPTLREALQRLHRDGWLVIRQGKGTRVNDFWRHGGLNVLSALVRIGRPLSPGFIRDLLEVRLVLAPAYARAAVERSPEAVMAQLEAERTLEEAAQAFAGYDWEVHHKLAVNSRNPIYPLILNGFAGFYEKMALRYFSRPEGRAASRSFYRELRAAARRGDGARAERVTRRAMQVSVDLWRHVEARPS